MTKVYTGTVKWFHRKRGFGYIICDDLIDSAKGGNPLELFVHYSQIKSPYEYRCLMEGERVQFTLGENDKGIMACDVAKIFDRVDEEEDDRR